MKTIYLSGAMSKHGPPDWGAANFKIYAERYRAQGFKVLSPPEMDADYFGNGGYEPENYRQCIKRDAVVLLGEADRIYMLPDWRDSKGATYERLAAQLVGIPVYDAESGELITTRLKAIEMPDPEGMEDAVDGN